MKPPPEDFYSWTLRQSKALRERRADSLDWASLAEEIEDMGRSEKRALQSFLEVLLAHLLKWLYQAGRRSRSWKSTIKISRIKCREILEDNPGLRSQLADIFQRAYKLARIQAADDMNLEESRLPNCCPWEPDQTLEDEFWPEKKQQ